MSKYGSLPDLSGSVAFHVAKPLVTTWHTSHLSDDGRNWDLNDECKTSPRDSP